MTRRLSVVYCIDNMGVGGTELNAVRSIELLRNEPFDFRVIALNANGPLRARYDAMRIEVVPWQIGSLYSVRTVLQITQLARRLRSWNVDVMHCHDRYTNFVGALSGKLARIPLVIASKRWGETSRRHWWTSAVAFRVADRVLANGPSTAESLRLVDHINPAKIAAIPNFIDDVAFERPDENWRAQQLSNLNIPSTAHVLGIVASLRPVKGHETLIRAMQTVTREMSDTYLVITGDGPSRRDLEQLATSLGVAERVRFTGIRPQHPSMHHLFDVSLLVSRSEGFPNSLVEAMAAGRPIIGTDVTGVRDAVRDGENGLLVPYGDAAALASAVLQMLRDPAARQLFGERGRKIARSEFSADRVRRALSELYLGSSKTTLD